MKVSPLKFIRQRTTKIRQVGDGTMFNPSTAELRRWLHDAATPKRMRCKLYAYLQYRKGRTCRASQ